MTAHHHQPPRDRRRRTCRDRWKHQRHQRRKATADPATSVFLQLLALVLVIVGRAPVVPTPTTAAVPAARPGSDGRSSDDRSPEAVERENGEGGHLMPPRRDSRRYGRYKAAPSYRRLVRDVQRPAARTEALDVLLRRLDLPSEAWGWLDELEREGDLTALLPYVRPGMTDLDSEAALLLAAIEWLEACRDPEQPTTSPLPPGDDGDGREGKGGDDKPGPPEDDDDGPPPPGGTKP